MISRGEVVGIGKLKIFPSKYCQSEIAFHYLSHLVTFAKHLNFFNSGLFYKLPEYILS